MLTERDREILSWIEKYKSITLSQIQYLFFNGSYESARRRMKQLENMKFVKSIQNSLLGNKVFFNDFVLNDHNLFVIEFLKFIKKQGGNIIEFKTQPSYMDNKIRPDAFIIFELKDNVYFILLEVDLNHYTSNSKMKKYEELYKKEELQKLCCGTFPIILISRPTKGIRYNSKNFNVIYTDLFYNNVNSLLFQNV